METRDGRLLFNQPGLDDPNAFSNNGDPFKEEMTYGVWQQGAFSPARPDRMLVDTEAEANLVSSMTTSLKHKPTIDIDLPCKLVPSKTEGHFHLFIEKELDWETYKRLLYAMADAGIVEWNYVYAANQAQATFVRSNPASRPERFSKPQEHRDVQPPAAHDYPPFR